ncbi:MAG TPA: universal stress protein [Chryseolinea sp.]|nr:universal stress protein [Chryseolinea sp.]
MQKTILIPTDFSIESLNLLKKAMQKYETSQFHVIFLHCLHSTDSIMDLLFSADEKLIESIVTHDFKEACKILKNKYGERIVTDRIEVFSGITQSAFQNFLEGNAIDEIFVPSEYTFKRTSKRSFDPVPFIRRSGLDITEVSWSQAENAPEKNQLAALFSMQ